MTDATIVTQHGHGRARAEAADEVDAHEEEPAERDHHGRAGEEHRAAGGVEREHGRLLGIEPVVQALAVAGDDEQRVVDADTEPEHRAELRRELRHDHTCESSVTIANPAAMPTSAVTIGSPIASTEPNATSRMTIAATSPITSDVPPNVG